VSKQCETESAPFSYLHADLAFGKCLRKVDFGNSNPRTLQNCNTWHILAPENTEYAACRALLSLFVFPAGTEWKPPQRVRYERTVPRVLSLEGKIVLQCTGRIIMMSLWSGFYKSSGAKITQILNNKNSLFNKNRLPEK
jgi:hypothetical protein